MGDRLVRAIDGAERDAVPYGTEALGVMRIEKGHAAGNELNGQTTAAISASDAHDVEEEGFHRPGHGLAPGLSRI
jgi:glycine cleavage system aminomethyltransferase T